MNLTPIENDMRDTSCSAVMNGEFYIFGQRYNRLLDRDHPDVIKSKRSIKKIVNCGLKSIGELPFEFHYGTCGTYLFPDERIFICFGDDDGKKCQR